VRPSLGKKLSKYITLGDLYVAYRKAKVEAFYENTHFHALAFTAYEQDLDANLRRLLSIVRDTSQPWLDHKLLGDYAYLPKSIDCGDWDKESEADGHFRAIDPLRDWEQRFDEKRTKAKVKMRLVIRPTVDFQIISTLWIMKVGHKFDATINSEVSLGNRLRRSSIKVGEKWAPKGPLTLRTHGLFVPYFSAYKQWRETGLSRMEKSLKEGKHILAITMDLEQFYHRVSPEFLLREEFPRSRRIKLSKFEEEFTRKLLAAINAWYRSTPDYSSRPQGALPVGLSASKIISNVLLAQFDSTVLQRVRPIYYGRYVDDIFLVFENKRQISGARTVIQRLANLLKPVCSIEPNGENAPSLRVNLPYAHDSDLIFAGPKQKIFALSSPHGLDLIQHIREQIRIQSSEHRLLPSLPNTAVEMASRALLATPDASLQVDALRKADVVSVRRLGLSLLLRDIDAYSADLAPESWIKIREQFYGLVKRHVVTPIGFFEFVSYVPRVFGLMLSCGDTSHAEQLIFDLANVIRILRRTTTASTSKFKAQFDLAVSQYALALLQTGIQASTDRTVSLDITYLRVLKKLQTLDTGIKVPRTTEQLRKLSRQVLLADWGRRPYKDHWYLDQQNANEEGPDVPSDFEVRRALRLAGIRRFRKDMAGLKNTPHWPALAFPTRPLKIDEISLVAPSVLENPADFRIAVMALRGAKVVSKQTLGFYPDKAEAPLAHLAVPVRQPDSIRVAVTSFKTTTEQWAAAARGNQDRTIERYRNLNGLVNRMLKESPRPNYMIFPELSLPLRWAVRIARKLAANNVSLLTGVEYRRDKAAGSLRNDCFMSLVTDWPGYRGYIARLQPKFLPAHGEREELKRLRLGRNGHMYEPTGLQAKPTVYTHGDFCFSVLICSDLTNISHRFRLRGQIDALFALEWNPDTKTFASLVEATANDLHAYVIQVNNRSYGDSRIRSPAKVDYSRDVVQVKGGSSDYYVVGDIDFGSLRVEQLRARDGTMFKPVPIGFEMAERRRPNERRAKQGGGRRKTDKEE
jgi:hypothetical protein